MRGKLEQNHPLAQYTSWRIGGPARIFYQPESVDDLADFLASLPSHEQNIIYLGFGSNVLISDQGIDGVVIHTKQLQQIQKTFDSMYVEAGVSLPQLGEHFPFLSGIPGTVGGALAMNSGAFGESIWDYVLYVDTIDRNGKRRGRVSTDFKIGYRHVVKPENEWFIGAKLNLQWPCKNSKEKLRELKLKRATTQPLGEPTCGSVFRNPPDDYAARLIEACGLKGKQIGGAIISEKHANFIVNKDNATAADIEALMKYIQHEVKQQTGVELIPEVRIIR
ncbi:MAG: UDP-N-acetylmuramate dehydrogenase [Gammaproteobacteria bacterium]|nr:UDP-N-acetylmuramate dehydrogenase [Gammaproteobacteria bacterium]